MQSNYPIGTPGTPWSDAEKAAWLAGQLVKRSYQQEVLSKLQHLPQAFQLEQYGTLPYTGDYPLFAIRNQTFNPAKPYVLVTGGVHGYETSGVQGAIHFALTEAAKYSDDFNLVILPCISPWGYETINRWNPLAIDPNRSFYADSPAPESAAVMDYLASLNAEFLVHVDLHETTDTDDSEFRPALAARDGVVFTEWGIPDGFYLVGDSENPQPEFQEAIIKAVEKVTHIAPADDKGMIIGANVEQHGVINYAKKALGLCGGVTNATYVTTTEVYPDSPKATPDNCIDAQVAVVCAALEFIQD